MLRQETPRVAAKHLAHAALHVIAYDRAADLATHRDSQARAGCASSAEHDEVRRMPPSCRPPERQVLPPAAHPRRLREALACGRGHLGCFGGIETVSRFRPLARRRFKICLPPGVAMRAMNPCVRKRRRLLG